MCGMWELVEMHVSHSFRATWEPCALWKHELLINSFHNMKLKFIKVQIKYFFILATVYGFIFIQCLHTVHVLSVTLMPFVISAGYPKCCQTNDLKVAGASSMVIRYFHSGCLPSSSSSSSLGSGRLDVPKVTNRSLDSSQVSWDRFLLTQLEISSLISRYLVTPLLFIHSTIFNLNNS